MKKPSDPRGKRPDKNWLPKRALIGMVHLPPLPGSAQARASIEAIARRACDEAMMLVEAGFDAVIIENYGDAPFFADDVPAVTAAAMAVVVDRVRREVPAPVGVNVLRNAATAALGVAAATGAAFIRVNVLSGVYATDQGLITGRAADVLRERARLCPNVRIAADVHVKHAAPLSQPDIARAAQDTAYRALADALIVSGQATGQAASAADVARVRAAVPDRPLWVGSGVTSQTAGELLEIADGLIVGTCLKQDGRTAGPLDPARARAFVKAVR